MLFRFRFFGIGLLFCAFFAAHSVASEAAQPEPTEWFANAADGTPLHWVVYTPAGMGPWPAVLVIHGGNFKGGTPSSSPESVDCARDLAAAGYIAFSIEYRLAPTGILPGQITDGRYPQQSDDVKLAVLAARNDSRCNGQVGSVGGSAGGSHTILVAGIGTVGQDRIDVGASFSGAYDYSDFSPDPNLDTFIANVTNYVGVSEEETDFLWAASPACQVDAETAPLFLVHTEEDSMPFSQMADLTTKLDALGLTNYQSLTLPGYGHAFAYWPQIKEQTIAFLAAGFAGVPPPPLPGPTATPTPEPDGSPTPPPVTAPTPAQMLVNVSTRVRVESGTAVMIGGFIVAGDTPKQVAMRALGPSLAAVGVTDALSDPVLELYDATGTLIAQNDNCSSLSPDGIPAGMKPLNDDESLIVITLPEGSYTGILRGANGATGVGLFELYDLDPASSRIINISTRGEVGSGSNAMIGGFIIGGEDPTKVIVRGIGPSLGAAGVTGALSDPVLELYDSSGSLISSNDNWRSTQEQEIIGTGVAPTDDRESAIIATLTPGSYTAVLSGSAALEGVGLVEIYKLESD